MKLLSSFSQTRSITVGNGARFTGALTAGIEASDSVNLSNSLFSSLISLNPINTRLLSFSYLLVSFHASSRSKRCCLNHNGSRDKFLWSSRRALNSICINFDPHWMGYLGLKLSGKWLYRKSEHHIRQSLTLVHHPLQHSIISKESIRMIESTDEFS